MKHIFVDLEMNKIGKNYVKQRQICRWEIIEFGAVMLDDMGCEIGEFVQYVKPQFGPISDYYAKLTGITNEKVEGEPHFHEAFTRFLDWCGEEDYRIYSWSDSDLNQLTREIELKEETDPRIALMTADWVDYQIEFGNILGVKQKISLMDAIHAIGVDFEGRQHDALWDARNTSEIFRLSLDTKRFNKVMKPLADLFHPQENRIGTSLADLLGADFGNFLS